MPQSSPDYLRLNGKKTSDKLLTYIVRATIQTVGMVTSGIVATAPAIPFVAALPFVSGVPKSEVWAIGWSQNLIIPGRNKMIV